MLFYYVVKKHFRSKKKISADAGNGRGGALSAPVGAREGSSRVTLRCILNVTKPTFS